MKNFKIFTVLMLLAVATPLYAQNTVNETSNDSTVTAIKVKELNERKADLKKQIAEQDKKRDMRIHGVAPETMEKLNERQDSVCLELRSQLVAVELELNELVPDKTLSTVAGKLNKLNQVQQSDKPKK